MFHGNFKGVSKKCQGCFKSIFKGVSREFQRNFKVPLKDILERFKEVPKVCHGDKRILRMLHRSVVEISKVLQRSPEVF